MTDSFMRFAGWTAYANAGLTIANMVTIMVFFAAGGFWGRLNDSVSVLWALSFIPLAIVLYGVNTPVNGPASLLAAVIILLRGSAPIVSAFHPVLALVDFALALTLAMRAWSLVPQSGEVVIQPVLEPGSAN